MKIILYLLLTLVLYPAYAMAGVTINYEGKFRSRDALESFVKAVEVRAKEKGWRVNRINEVKTRETRLIDEKEVPYEGPIQGLRIQISDACEPLQFRVGSDLFFQDFVKTQFGGASDHLAVVEILDLLKPFAQKLDVDDEGEYYEERNLERLKENLSSAAEAIEETR